MNDCQGGQPQGHAPMALPQENTRRKPEETRGCMAGRKGFLPAAERRFAECLKLELSSKFPRALRTGTSVVFFQDGINDEPRAEHHRHGKEPAEDPNRPQTRCEKGSDPENEGDPGDNQGRPGSIGVEELNERIVGQAPSTF
jgi:hypothetical protein